MRGERRIRARPLRDAQRARPAAYCRRCGGELYRYDPALREDGCVRSAPENQNGWRTRERAMTLFELSIEYRAQAEVLRTRIRELRTRLPELEPDQRSTMEARLRMLTAMWREARDLAVFCERYYDRGYRRNGRYTI